MFSEYKGINLEISNRRIAKFPPIFKIKQQSSKYTVGQRSVKRTTKVC